MNIIKKIRRCQVKRVLISGICCLAGKSEHFLDINFIAPEFSFSIEKLEQFTERHCY